jgi:hypothetical protein
MAPLCREANAQRGVDDSRPRAYALHPIATVNTAAAGYLGVLWPRFAGGTEFNPEQIAFEGIYLIAPWNKLPLYDRWLQSIKQTYHVISKDGVVMFVTTNVRFQINFKWFGVMHQSISLLPEIGNRTREVIANFTAEEVCRGTTRSQHRGDILDSVGPRFVGVANTCFGGEDGGCLTRFDALIFGVALSPALVGTINRKNEQLYVKQECQFRVERERLEAKRKVIEATGIRDFQTTIGAGISDCYLRWCGIDTTLQLMESSNAKIVIVGAGKDGVPLILGNTDSPAPQPQPTPLVDRPAPALNAPLENRLRSNRPSDRPDNPADATLPQPPIGMPGSLSGAILPGAPVVSSPPSPPVRALNDPELQTHRQ